MIHPILYVPCNKVKTISPKSTRVYTDHLNIICIHTARCIHSFVHRASIPVSLLFTGLGHVRLIWQRLNTHWKTYACLLEFDNVAEYFFPVLVVKRKRLFHQQFRMISFTNFTWGFQLHVRCIVCVKCRFGWNDSSNFVLDSSESYGMELI